MLVNNCPLSYGNLKVEEKEQGSFLPPDKQFLYTTNILSNRMINKEVYQEHIVEKITEMIITGNDGSL